MRRIYARLTGHRESFQTLMYHSKRFIMQSAMASEMAVLAHALNDISESHRRSRDFTLNGLRKALTEVIACFPVYRTYVSARGASDTDRHVIHQAIARARRRNPAMESTIFDFIQSVLLPPAPLDDPTPEGDADRQRRLAFAMKFQQYTGPVHAKGVEDTSFYRYNVLVSLNEVGGDPERFGRTPADFHEANRRRLERWPLEMIGTATHDTKRGEDVRARINVLSEMPDAWRKAVGRWTRITGSARTRVDGDHAPDRNDEYLFYQTLIGTWPAEDLDAPVPREATEEYAERIRAYMRKAIKEAKAHTSWVNENRPVRKGARRLRHQHAARRHGGGVSRGVRALPAPGRAARRDQFVVTTRPQNDLRRASSTSIKATSCGISISSIPTTVSRWISPSRRGLLEELTAARAA